MSKTFREILKENTAFIWWEEEPAPNNVTKCVIEWLQIKRQELLHTSSNPTYAVTIIDDLLTELMK